MKKKEGNKLIVKFMGYYQPKEPKDDLYSFEVYSSIKKCMKDYPEDEIVTYFDDDIEDFQIVDKPKYDCSWDWLMQVIAKISIESEEPEELDGLKHALLCDDIDTAWKFVVDYLQK
jgi:hypothetical protein